MIKSQYRIIVLLFAFCFFISCSSSEKKNNVDYNSSRQDAANFTRIQILINDYKNQIITKEKNQDKKSIIEISGKILNIDPDNIFALNKIIRYDSTADSVIKSSANNIKSDTAAVFKHYRDYLIVALYYSYIEKYNDSVDILKTALSLKPYRPDVSQKLSEQFFLRALKNSSLNINNNTIISDLLNAYYYNSENYAAVKNLLKIFYKSNI